ncbi:MAG: alanine--tRNA ligase [Patescibacteria group bacterium]
MNVSEVRRKYLDFFRAREHAVVPSARLVPENDPTTLFTSSGMQPLLPYLLGSPHPQGTRIANSQKSFRSQDIEEIGNNRHTTFFEMLGNWSFGDYFKKEQIPWFYEFLTEELDLPAPRLSVTCFSGDEQNGIPRDLESAEIWRGLGIPDERIRFYGAEKNWWSRAGVPAKMPPGEPGGPDSEVFYDFGTPHDPAFGETCHPNCDCGRFMEIGNSVFMEYVKTDTGFSKLPKANVDFGGGLERLAAATRGDSDVFLIDTIRPIVVELAARSGKNYNDPAFQKSFRIVADHARAATFMLADGVMPSNTDQGYVLRRLLRRAIRHLDKLGVGEGMFPRIAELVAESYGEHYTELAAMRLTTNDAMRDEEVRFRKTLTAGLREFEKKYKVSIGNNLVSEGLQPSAVFELVTTFGFPFELVKEVAGDRGLYVDDAAFQELMQKHKDLSRAGAAQKFAGGLADHSEQTVKYHTAHHLLLRALREVLGPEVHQRGSNITSERLRIDFSAPHKMTKEELARVEELVNEKIAEALPVVRSDIPRSEAERLGAEHEFGVKYPEMVSVYSIGPAGATREDPKFAEAFSLEFCGGPHVANTADIGEPGKRFKILKEEAVAAGIRRIKAMVA